jgi:hypothetical protein
MNLGCSNDGSYASDTAGRRPSFRCLICRRMARAQLIAFRGNMYTPSASHATVPISANKMGGLL